MERNSDNNNRAPLLKESDENGHLFENVTGGSRTSVERKSSKCTSTSDGEYRSSILFDQQIQGVDMYKEFNKFNDKIMIGASRSGQTGKVKNIHAKGAGAGAETSIEYNQPTAVFDMADHKQFGKPTSTEDPHLNLRSSKNSPRPFEFDHRHYAQLKNSDSTLVPSASKIDKNWTYVEPFLNKSVCKLQRKVRALTPPPGQMLLKRSSNQIPMQGDEFSDADADAEAEADLDVWIDNYNMKKSSSQIDETLCNQLAESLQPVNEFNTNCQVLASGESSSIHPIEEIPLGSSSSSEAYELYDYTSLEENSDIDDDAAEVEVGGKPDAEPLRKDKKMVARLKSGRTKTEVPVSTRPSRKILNPNSPASAPKKPKSLLKPKIQIQIETIPVQAPLQMFSPSDFQAIAIAHPPPVAQELNDILQKDMEGSSTHCTTQVLKSKEVEPRSRKAVPAVDSSTDLSGLLPFEVLEGGSSEPTKLISKRSTPTSDGYKAQDMLQSASKSVPEILDMCKPSMGSLIPEKRTKSWHAYTKIGLQRCKTTGHGLLKRIRARDVKHGISFRTLHQKFSPTVKLTPSRANSTAEMEEAHVKKTDKMTDVKAGSNTKVESGEGRQKAGVDICSKNVEGKIRIMNNSTLEDGSEESDSSSTSDRQFNAKLLKSPTETLPAGRPESTDHLSQTPRLKLASSKIPKAVSTGRSKSQQAAHHETIAENGAQNGGLFSKLVAAASSRPDGIHAEIKNIPISCETSAHRLFKEYLLSSTPQSSVESMTTHSRSSHHKRSDDDEEDPRLLPDAARYQEYYGDDQSYDYYDFGGINAEERRLLDAAERDADLDIIEAEREEYNKCLSDGGFDQNQIDIMLNQNLYQSSCQYFEERPKKVKQKPLELTTIEEQMETDDEDDDDNDNDGGPIEIKSAAESDEEFEKHECSSKARQYLGQDQSEILRPVAASKSYTILPPQTLPFTDMNNNYTAFMVRIGDRFESKEFLVNDSEFQAEDSIDTAYLNEIPKRLMARNNGGGSGSGPSLDKIERPVFWDFEDMNQEIEYFDFGIDVNSNYYDTDIVFENPRIHKTISSCTFDVSQPEWKELMVREECFEVAGPVNVESKSTSTHKVAESESLFGAYNNFGKIDVSTATSVTNMVEDPDPADKYNKSTNTSNTDLATQLSSAPSLADINSNDNQFDPAVPSTIPENMKLLQNEVVCSNSGRPRWFETWASTKLSRSPARRCSTQVYPHPCSRPTVIQRSLSNTIPPSSPSSGQPAAEMLSNSRRSSSGWFTYRLYSCLHSVFPHCI